PSAVVGVGGVAENDFALMEWKRAARSAASARSARRFSKV
ncbi:MAG: hypothetical protein QOC71_1037, partial [Thermoplasmata archaeon]|nr:hypothetical protein [Thermoplasmata archaeon]